MASLLNGRLTNTPIAPQSESGEFVRASSNFHGQIPGTSAEPNRYHLYVSYACPWAHRTLIVRNLKKLQDIISVSVTDPYMGEKGWTLSDSKGVKYLAVLYIATEKDYTGKITVPVLWDKKNKRIVNNESSEIIRIFNSSFNHLTNSDIDLYPISLRPEIDQINQTIYENINNGVYKTGFASHQKAYEENFKKLFMTLEEVDTRLKRHPFLVGDKITEADIRLFTTLIRFDCVYYTHFKCNWRRITEYHNLYNYMKAIYQIPEVKETVHFDHIKEHYFKSHTWLNPQGIIPLGPEEDLESPHDRGKVDFYRSIDL